MIKLEFIESNIQKHLILLGNSLKTQIKRNPYWFNYSDAKEFFN
jgi:hypothetical protein